MRLDKEYRQDEPFRKKFALPLVFCLFNTNLDIRISRP